ncbi:MAG: DUF3842 family protein [Eubacteriales bacterium]|nr:DUF3842 family protein [Eubacteriales bacterium]
MKVLVIDGQGGGVGKALVTALHTRVPGLELIALGTNAAATAAMLRAGALQAATGESAIRYQCQTADVIVGVIGIMHANALLGEISPAIAAAVSRSQAQKVLIPLDRCGVHIAGVARKPLDELIAEAADMVAALAAPGQ